jgi:hypothetical protein
MDSRHALAGLALIVSLLGATEAMTEDIVTGELQPPKTLSAEYTDGERALVLLRYHAVASATSYRIYREIMVEYDAATSGELVALDEPKTAWVPWGLVEAVPGVDTISIMIATLDDANSRFGIATEVTEAGQTQRSAIAVFPSVDVPTAAALTSWGMLKRSR